MRLGIIECEDDLLYSPMFARLLHDAAFPAALDITAWRAQDGLPEDLDACDGWLISGSNYSAYENREWIKKLGDWIKRLHAEKRKLIGICFGHQIIAQALGGQVARMDGGFEVDVCAFQPVNLKSWMEPQLEWCRMIYYHQDHVSRLPEGAVSHGGDETCPCRMFSVGDHILGIQGHPEFEAEWTRELIVAESRDLGEAAMIRGLKGVDQPTDTPLVACWMMHFLAGRG